MRILKRYFILILFCISFRGFAQHWQSAGGGTCGGTAAFGDTVNNILYVANYMSCAGTIPVNNIAQWNGTSWDSLAGGSFYNPVQRDNFAFFGGKMVCPCWTLRSNYCYIASWNGIKWDSIGANFSINVDSFATFDGVALLNGELYAFGTFDSINHVYYNGIAKWDGINWVPLGFPYRDSGGQPLIESLALYNGNLYAGGRFTDSLNNRKYIAKFDGTHWSIPGGGFSGGADDVFDLEVYKNELYAAGSFSVSDGNITSGIARWNDTTWRAVGGGVTGPYGFVNDLLIFNNKLYAGGAYNGIGGVPAGGLASWDGTNWCSYGTDTIHGTVLCLATINHELYAITGSIFDNDTVNCVAQWIGGSYTDGCGHLTTGISEEQMNNESVNIYPNPATDQITIEFDLAETKNTLIEIKNVLGQTVKTINNLAFSKGANKIEIDVSDFLNGLYFIQLQSKNIIMNNKFVKQ